jgi:hypothetical protein
MKQMLNCIRQWVRVWPLSPQQKQTRPIASLGCGGVDVPANVVGVRIGPETFEIGGGKHEGIAGNVMLHGRGRQNMLATFEGIEVGGAIHKDVQNASLAIQFSLHRMAAAYHCWGELSKGQPDVRQAT